MEVPVDQQPLLFGPELRRLRLASGYTLGRFSDRVHYSKSHLSQVERGLKPAGPELARLCDSALGAGGRLARLVPQRPSGTAPETLPDPCDEGEEWHMHLSPDGDSWFRPVDRRTLVAGGAASVVTLGLGSGPAHTQAPHALRSARLLFDQYRALGQSAPPGALLPTLVAQTHTLRTLARRAAAPLRAELLQLASRYAEFVGWLVQENGDDTGALWWTERSVRLAQAGGDHDLAAYALVRKALIAFYRDDAAHTVELARRAQEAHPPPRIAGLAAQQEAQGHALAGDRSACMRALERAREQLATADSPDGPVIGTVHLPDPVSMITGWCLHDLGRPRAAAAVLDEQIARLPEHALRNQARYGTRRALAHAQAGELDHACTLAGPLLDHAEAVGSATIRTDLRKLKRTLARHTTHRAARELDQRLTAVLHPEPHG